MAGSVAMNGSVDTKEETFLKENTDKSFGSPTEKENAGDAEEKKSGLFKYITDTCTMLKNIFTTSSVPLNSHVDTLVTDKPTDVIYRQAVARTSGTPYIVKFRNSSHIICGIACTPRDEKTASPEVDVLRGGIGHDYVDIRLTPVARGYWACAIELIGTFKTPELQ